MSNKESSKAKPAKVQPSIRQVVGDKVKGHVPKFQNPPPPPPKKDK